MILLGEGEGADAKRRLLDRAGATVVGEDEESVLAIVAIEDEAEASAAVARLRARGTLVNAVDRPALCDFTLPAIIDRDPVIVAIGTGGASAGLAKALRQRLEAILPSDLGQRALFLADARTELRERFPDPLDRRRAIDAALGQNGPLDVLGACGSPRGFDWGTATQGAETVVVELSSANPDDLTLRQARHFANADRLYHDGSIPAAILARARADAAQLTGAPPATTEPGLTLVVRMRP